MTIFPGKRNIFPSKAEKNDGTDPSNQKELLNEWKGYFNLLLNNKSDIVEIDLLINLDPPFPRRQSKQ